MPPNSRARSSAERNRAAGRRCEVQGCYRLVLKLGRYCDHHDAVNLRTGHPLGHTIRLGELRPYVSHIKAYIAANRDHPAIAACLQWLHALVYGQRLRNLQRNTTATPRQRLSRWLDQLERSGVHPHELLAITAVMYAYREDKPQAFKSDRHFQHQLVVRFLRKAPAPYVNVWRAGEGGKRYDRVTVAVRDLLARTLSEAIGLPCLNMAKAILRTINPINPDHAAAIRVPLPDYHQPQKEQQ